MEAVHCTWYTVDMHRLNSMLFRADDGDYNITLHYVSSKSYTGVDRKLKGENVVAIIKTDEGKFIALVEE